MPSAPQLLVGQVMHQRLRPVPNAFVYPVFFCRLPLARLVEAGNAVFSIGRFNLLGFSVKDHGPRDGSPLLPWIRELLARHGVEADGEVVLQCFPRVLGYVFNPVTFWFCHDGEGQLRAVLAEVHNTFGERHNYLLHRDDHGPLRDGERLTARKVFHVSPFCAVEGEYRFRFHGGAGRHIARIDYDDGHGDLLHTAISGRLHEWRPGTLLRALLRMPLMTAHIMLRIHWQAMKLWWHRVPWVPKPAAPTQETTR